MRVISGPHYVQEKSTTRSAGKTYWKVTTRSGDVIQYHKFQDEDAANDFAKSLSK